MAWVEFTAPFDFTPKANRAVTIAYPAGHRGSVTAECARAAIAKGRAKRIRTPTRAQRDVLSQA